MLLGFVSEAVEVYEGNQIELCIRNMGNIARDVEISIDVMPITAQGIQFLLGNA